MSFYRKKQNSPVATWIRLTIYVIMLLMVGAAMRLIVSNDGRDFLKNLFVSNEPEVRLETHQMNWCPLAVNKMTLLSTNKEITDAEKLFSLCEIESVPFEAKDLEKVTFHPFLSATAGAGDQLVLEVGSLPGFFRIGDLPFKSLSLEKELSKYK